MRAFALLLLVTACAPMTQMQFHRQRLDTKVRRVFDCERGELIVEDETPEGFRYGNDPAAGRYRVEACGREDYFVCFQMPEANVSETLVECRQLGQPTPRGRVGVFEF